MIDKPKGITSHDVVDAVRRATGDRRVGHAGTLDPNATGLLIVGVGREFTKKLGSITKDTDKTYEAEIYLGETRDTDDSEGNVLIKSTDFIQPDKDNINRVLKEFIGEQDQMPPAFSAIKMAGKKAYELARKGIDPELSMRKVVVHSIKLDSYEFPILRITCRVSSGTYIRSLARDIGQNLGCGAYLKELRRTKIGKFSVEKAIGLQELSQLKR